MTKLIISTFGVYLTLDFGGLMRSILKVLLTVTVVTFTTASHADDCSNAIESQIEGTFEGWSGETIFKLTNGQIWQQSSYSYTYHYAYRPEVLIYSAGGGCKMKVDGVSDSISVKRLK